MGKIFLWTKQHKSVLEKLTKDGIYHAQKAFIKKELGEDSDLVLFNYDWLVKKAADFVKKPEGAEYPIWLSYKQEATMLEDSKSVILKISVPEDFIIPVNIGKWSRILDYSYIPDSPEDETNHRRKLKDYGISDQKVMMSGFYPVLKREITESWDRLFDENIILDNNNKYALLWELKREWISNE